MQSQRTFRPYPEARSTPRGALHAMVTPRHNKLIAALPDADYLRLLPHLEPAPLLRGMKLHRAGERERFLYFIADGIVSRFHELEGGTQAGLSITGREGAVGISGFLGGEGVPSQAVVLCAGYAYRLSIEALHREFPGVASLTLLLLRYTQALITQVTQTVVCNRFHSVEQQLCGRILSCMDRLPSNDLTLTQELLSDMLGVRRESITDAAGALQAAGLIRYSRGRIAVADRAGLEARACECYGVVKREYERLLPEQVEPLLAVVRADPLHFVLRAQHHRDALM
jgi:CRP-like cAMP-binding protein